MINCLCSVTEAHGSSKSVSMGSNPVKGANDNIRLWLEILATKYHKMVIYTELK